MMKNLKLRKFGRWLLIAFMLVVFADVAFGYYVQVDSTDWCKSHSINKAPGRGPGTPSWSTDEYNAIVHSCRIHGLENRVAYTQLPFNKVRLERKLAGEIARCDEVMGDRQFRGWGCQDR